MRIDCTSDVLFTDVQTSDTQASSLATHFSLYHHQVSRHWLSPPRLLKIRKNTVMLQARTILFFWLCLASTALAQSRVSQAVTASLSNSTALRGQAVRLAAFNLQVVTNETSALVTFNLTRTAVAKVGWIGFGTGSRMSNSDMLVAWPTVSGRNVTWTLSQRTASKPFAVVIVCDLIRHTQAVK